MSEATTLAVVWSSADPDVAHKVCFMFTHNAKRMGWFEEVYLVVWGPSAVLATKDDSIAAKIKEMGADGVILKACKACSDSYGVSEALEALGVSVEYMGVPLTNALKSDDVKVLTF